MGAYTYYTNEEISDLLSSVKDEELKALIIETNEATGRVYFVSEYLYSQERVLRKTVVSNKYSLYVKVSEAGEVRCINFAPLSDFKTTSLNFTVDKSFIMTFLFGVLSGVAITKEFNQKTFAVAAGR